MKIARTSSLPMHGGCRCTYVRSVSKNQSSRIDGYNSGRGGAYSNQRGKRKRGHTKLRLRKKRVNGSHLPFEIVRSAAVAAGFLKCGIRFHERPENAPPVWNVTNLKVNPRSTVFPFSSSSFSFLKKSFNFFAFCFFDGWEIDTLEPWLSFQPLPTGPQRSTPQQRCRE